MKGTLIKQHRKFNNMTLEELADGICSVSYLSKIEHDSISASDEIYRLLEQRLNIKLIDINDEFDEDIYQDLLDWHEAAQLQDTELMEEYDQIYNLKLKENENTELNNLYHVIKARHDMKISIDPLPPNVIKKLESIYPSSTKEYKFFFHKTLGVHHLLANELKPALHHFKETYSLLKYVHFHDSETYFHLCMTYSKLITYSVESNYYGEKALEGYIKDLNYTRIIDTYMIMAFNYDYLNSYDIAEEYYFKILKVARDHLDLESKRRIYENIGFAKTNKQEFSEGLSYLKKAETIDTPDHFFKVNTIYLIAYAYYHCNQLDKCWEYIKEGEWLATHYNFTLHTHKFFVLKNEINGTTYSDTFINRMEKVIIPDVKELNHYERYKDYLEMLGDIFYEKRLYKKAASCYKEANIYKFPQKKGD